MYDLYKCEIHGLQKPSINENGDACCHICFRKEFRLNQGVVSGLNKSNSSQIGGSHYKDKAIQPWDYIVSNGLGYLEGNIVKYVSRYKDKNGLEDLKKARHYLDKLIETQEGK